MSRESWCFWMVFFAGAYLGILGSIGVGVGWAAGIAAALLFLAVVAVEIIDRREFRQKSNSGG